ncbi:MAG TPA: MFS transporter [Bacteroidota bacterium]|jgi:MFS family permease|nr:MFS transporter [Bacteroidota bacterium]
MTVPTVERPPFYILPVIIISQFAGTSLWFASNAVLPDLQRAWNLPADAVGYLTSSVQLGFIAGTLLFAFFTIADRWSPRKIFFVCSVSGGLCNLLIYLCASGFSDLLLLRFLVGFSLAGIYPIGMKIASGWYKEGLGSALGFLVGALVLGTSFPHLVRSVVEEVHWESVTLAVSMIASMGGLLMLLLVPDGPYLTKGMPFNPKALAIIFRSRELRAAASGYFGHMWELYTFYAFIPIVLSAYAVARMDGSLNISLWSFMIIAAGSVGCAAGGIISKRIGSAKVAWAQLVCSGALCVISPLLFQFSPAVTLGLFVVWGVVVVGDSPQFSALIARYAPRELVGSALTIGNSIGFAITIVSIQFVTYLSHFIEPQYIFSLLTIGPVLGLVAFRPLIARPRSEARSL